MDTTLEMKELTRDEVLEILGTAPEYIDADTLNRLSADTLNRLSADTLNRLSADTLNSLSADTLNRLSADTLNSLSADTLNSLSAYREDIEKIIPMEKPYTQILEAISKEGCS